MKTPFSLLLLITIVFSSCNKLQETTENKVPLTSEIEVNWIEPLGLSGFRVSIEIQSNNLSYSSSAEWGICYGLSSNPTIEDTKIVSTDNSYYSFFVDILDLAPGTQYFGRSYYQYGTEVGYSLDFSFTTPAASIGTFKEGGIVFWVNPNDTLHGLVCAIEDCNNGNISNWSATNNLTNASGFEVGTGLQNTNSIIALNTTGAAKICDDYISNGYNDWYLPSIDELYILYTYRFIINATALQNGGNNFSSNYNYWSSTEINEFYAYQVVFSSGGEWEGIKSDYGRNRAIRTF
jgi:hypothetical protein